MYPGVLIPVSTPCEIPAAEDFAMTGLTRAGYADINALLTCEAARERNVRTTTMTKNKSSAHLSKQEVKDALRRSAPSATVVFEAIRHEAVEELARSNTVLFWSGLAAGLSMGFSFIAEALLQSALPDD